MSAQDNIKVVRKLYDIYNKNDSKNLNALDEVIATNVQLHDPASPSAKSGLQSIKQIESSYINSFPNKSIKIDNIFGSDDYVAVKWTCKGTQKGEFRGFAPTNKAFTITGTSIYRVNDGKVTEIRQNWDRLGLLEQIGAYHTESRQQQISR